MTPPPPAPALVRRKLLRAIPHRCGRGRSRSRYGRHGFRGWHGRRRRRNGSRSRWVVFFPSLQRCSPWFVGDRTRCPRRRRYPWQPHVRFQRGRLRRSQKSGQRLQRQQDRGEDRRTLGNPNPSDSHRAHPRLRREAPELSPEGPQAVAERAASMSFSWSSTQSPGLWEKMISRRPSAHCRFCSGSMVSARWIASACSWMSNGLTEIT